MWDCKPLLDESGLLLLGLLFAVQFFVSFQFVVGRPDHHGLNIMLFIWQMSFALRLGGLGWADSDVRSALWAALPATFAIWISIEGVIGTAMILIALVICLNHPGRRRIAAFEVVFSRSVPRAARGPGLGTAAR